MELIKKAKWAYVGISTIMIILGLLLIINPQISALAVCYVIGALVTIFGIIKLIGYFSKDLFRLAFQFDFALGIFSLIAGILMLLHPGNIIKIVPVIIGVFVILDGALKLQTSNDARKFGLKSWWLVLIFALLSCAGGIVLVLAPFEGAMAIMVLLGISLIVDGIQNFCTVIYTVKAVRSED